MKRFLYATALAVLLPLTALANTSAVETQNQDLELSSEFYPELEISADSTVKIGKSIIFEVQSNEEISEKLNFEWAFGDGNKQQGTEVVHSYVEPGAYEVSLFVTNTTNLQASPLIIEHKLFVHEKNFVLISNVEEKQERIMSFIEGAEKENIYIEAIEVYGAQSEFLEEENLKRSILENIQALEKSDTLLVWTEGSSGLTVFTQLTKNLEEEDFFKNKDIIFFTESDFESLENIARGVHQSIHPKNIALTRTESDWALIEHSDIESFTKTLEERGIQYKIVNENIKLRPWNFMSVMVNSMIQHGVPTNTIRLVLMLSVIVTIVATMKQVIGLNTLGVYTPSILALSFIALDLLYGLIFLIAILVTGSLVRLFLRRYRLLYIPRMAIVLATVSITILVLLWLGASFEISEVVGIAVFPMLIMSTMVEKFVSIQSGKGLKRALKLVGETVLVAIICYYVAEWNELKVFMLGHPEAIFLFLGVNIFLARWTGLRVIEYFRFREIIRYAEE